MQKEEVKKNKIIELLKKDYPAESLILAILGVVVIVFGVYLIDGSILAISNRTEWYLAWAFGNDTRILIFSIVVVIVGFFAFGFAVWPFVKPSVQEMNKVSWPTGKIIKNHTLRVFGFIIFIALAFVVYDLALLPLFGYLTSIGG